MRHDARRSWVLLWAPVVGALVAAPSAGQEGPAAGDGREPRSASEILAAAAEEAARERDHRQADPPQPPADGEVTATDLPDDATPPNAADPPPVPLEDAASPAPLGAHPSDTAATGAEHSDAHAQGSPVTAAPPRSQPLEPARFQGVTPGQTTRGQLHEKWGEPKRVERIPGGVRESFHNEAFAAIQVAVLEDVVDSVMLKLKQPMEVEEVVDRLHLAGCEPAEIFDKGGELLGYAYPERGMLFGFDAQSERPHVAHIVIESIGAAAFLARAEARKHGRFADCLADLRQAQRLAPTSGRAYALEAEILLWTGELERANKLAAKAVEVEPKELAHRIMLAKVLSASGDHRQALQQALAVVETARAAPLSIAQAYCQLGDCVAASPERDFKQAIDHHMQAARRAAPLTKSDEAALRRAAKEVQLNAYLGAAYDIGQGHWQQKADVAGRWLEAALRVADDLVQHEGAGAETRFRVDEGALAALSGIAAPPDASKWTDGAAELGGVLLRDADDAAYKAHVAWRLAVALSDATEIETARGQHERAMQLGNMAMAYFAEGEAVSRQLPTRDYLRGWLCYRMGAIHAIHRADHRQAVAWFRHAVPLLESPAPPSAIVNSARHGETFVSMAVSYWELGERKEALRLTEQGLTLMELASADGQLEKSALAVPYGNLARMHQQLGDAAAARRFADLAARVQALAPK
jgi:tetratricopeptide (TPR) repeat protein